MKSQHKVGTSRVSNLDRVQDLVFSEHADIVLISETWLNANILDQELFPLSDFIVYRIMVVAFLLPPKPIPSNQCGNMCRTQKTWRT